MTLFTGITPLYGSSFAYAGPVGVVWGWVIVTFFTWFVGFAMAEICSSFPVRTENKHLIYYSKVVRDRIFVSRRVSQSINMYVHIIFVYVVPRTRHSYMQWKIYWLCHNATLLYEDTPCILD